MSFVMHRRKMMLRIETTDGRRSMLPQFGMGLGKKTGLAVVLILANIFIYPPGAFADTIVETVELSMYPFSHSFNISGVGTPYAIKAPYEIRKGPHDYDGALFAPDGFKICLAQLLWKTAFIGSQGTLTATLQGPSDHLAYYAHSQDDGVAATIQFTLVAANDATQACMSPTVNQGAVFQCGKNTSAGEKDCVEKQAGGVVR